MTCADDSARHRQYVELFIRSPQRRRPTVIVVSTTKQTRQREPFDRPTDRLQYYGSGKNSCWRAITNCMMCRLATADDQRHHYPHHCRSISHHTLSHFDFAASRRCTLLFYLPSGHREVTVSAAAAECYQCRARYYRRIPRSTNSHSDFQSSAARSVRCLVCNSALPSTGSSLLALSQMYSRATVVVGGSI